MQIAFLRFSDVLRIGQRLFDPSYRGEIEMSAGNYNLLNAWEEETQRDIYSLLVPLES